MLKATRHGAESVWCRCRLRCTRWRCTLVQPGEYDWTVHVRRWCAWCEVATCYHFLTWCTWCHERGGGTAVTACDNCCCFQCKVLLNCLWRRHRVVNLSATTSRRRSSILTAMSTLIAELSRTQRLRGSSKWHLLLQVISARRRLHLVLWRCWFGIWPVKNLICKSRRFALETWPAWSNYWRLRRQTIMESSSGCVVLMKDTCLTASFSRTIWVSRHQKG